MEKHLTAVWICVAMTTVWAGLPPEYDHQVALPTNRPLNIAHRGESGVYPEHTARSYRAAIKAGCDVIECDVISTKDRSLICLHDPWLSTATNVASRPEFANKKRTYFVPDKNQNITDWFAMDFTLSEIITLKVKQRFDFRDQSYNLQDSICTFEEFINIAKEADRPIGIYPEVKNPRLINAHSSLQGTSLEKLVVSAVEAKGFSKKQDPCFIQCFEEDTVQRLLTMTNLPVVMLISDDVPDSSLKRWADWGVYGVGAWKEQLVRMYTDQSGYKNRITPTNFTASIKAHGLRIHVYTFRNEDRYLAWDFHQDSYEEYQYFLDLGIDGYFTDFPASLDRFLDQAYAPVVANSGYGNSARSTPIYLLSAAWLCVWLTIALRLCNIPSSSHVSVFLG